MIRLILASASPRRRELLRLLGFSFSVVEPSLKESMAEGGSPEETVRQLSLEKALEVAKREGEGMVISADTLVVLGNRVLGKPADPEEAVEMLCLLRGRRHKVYSAVTLLDASWGEAEAAVTETTVRMRRYSDEAIYRYVARGEPFDKAGGYAIQDREFRPASRVEGCYANVMGLPLCDLSLLLARRGVLSPFGPVGVCQALMGYRCPWADPIWGLLRNR